MSSYKIESGDVSAIRFAVDNFIRKTHEDTMKQHIITQKNINLSHVTQKDQLYIQEDEPESDYSEYDEHDEGIWFSDPDDSAEN